MSRRLPPRFLAGLMCLVAGPAAAQGDPTRPPAGLAPSGTEEPAAAPAGEGARLTSILHGNPSRARINGVWLRAGEEHAGLRVIRIERRRVIVREEGERRELSLQGRAAIKRPVDDKEHP